MHTIEECRIFRSLRSDRQHESATEQFGEPSLRFEEKMVATESNFIHKV